MGIRADTVAAIPRYLNTAHPGYPESRERLIKVIKKEARIGTLDVWWDRAAFALRERCEPGVDWQNMPADSPKFHWEVATFVVAFLYETSDEV